MEFTLSIASRNDCDDKLLDVLDEFYKNNNRYTCTGDYVEKIHGGFDVILCKSNNGKDFIDQAHYILAYISRNISIEEYSLAIGVFTSIDDFMAKFIFPREVISLLGKLCVDVGVSIFVTN